MTKDCPSRRRAPLTRRQREALERAQRLYEESILFGCAVSEEATRRYAENKKILAEDLPPK